MPNFNKPFFIFQMTFLKSYLVGFETKLSSEPGYVPELFDLIIIDALIASFQISLDKIFSSSNISTLSESLIEDLKREDFVGTLPQCVEYVQQLVPSIARYISFQRGYSLFFLCLSVSLTVRWCYLHVMETLKPHERGRGNLWNFWKWAVFLK